MLRGTPGRQAGASFLDPLAAGRQRFSSVADERRARDI